MKKRKKDQLTTVLLVCLFLAGLSLLLYPSVSNWWNERLQAEVIVKYEENLSTIDEEKYARILEEAQDYNARLAAGADSEELQKEYMTLLDPYGSGYMGYVEIPSIGVKLPIAHGTDDSVLDKAVGHLDWTSLPVGGESTHSVVSGHRGLPSAELLTNLDKLEPGDLFYIHVLGEKLEYQVDAVNVVLPDDAALLQITEGKDYVTLLTCTPYGINTHRLLVRGARVDHSRTGEHGPLLISNEVEPISMVFLLPICLAGLFGLLFVLVLVDYKLQMKGYRGKRVAPRHPRSPEKTEEEP